MRKQAGTLKVRMSPFYLTECERLTFILLSATIHLYLLVSLECGFAVAEV